MPQKKKSVSGAPLSYKASAEDDRAARSSSEYMTSASKRMSMLSSAMSGEKKRKDMEASYEMDEETASEAADSQAMSILDLLASLEGSGHIDQAKSKIEAATRPPSAKPTRPPGGTKKGVVDVPDRRMPQKKKSVSGAPLSYKASAEDDRAARSSSEYMTSASKRMSMLSSAMSGEKKRKDMEASYEMDEETAAEAADSQAMSMPDLLASLEGKEEENKKITKRKPKENQKKTGRKKKKTKRKPKENQKQTKNKQTNNQKKRKEKKRKPDEKKTGAPPHIGGRSVVSILARPSTSLLLVY